MQFFLTRLKGVTSESSYLIVEQLYQQCNVIEQEMSPFLSNRGSKHKEILFLLLLLKSYILVEYFEMLLVGMF